MTKTIVLFMCLAASSLSFDGRAQDTEGAYTVRASVLNVEGAPDAQDLAAMSDQDVWP